MNPGTTVLPPRSSFLVPAAARAPTSALEPTARMRSPAIATASAAGWLASMVRTAPLVRMRSGRSRAATANARGPASDRPASAVALLTKSRRETAIFSSPCGHNRAMSGVLYRYAAFTTTPQGGNPAGIWIGDTHPPDAEMQRIASEVAYPETIFVAPAHGLERKARYFSPAKEMDFCGHATIATGVLFGSMAGAGEYRVATNV